MQPKNILSRIVSPSSKKVGLAPGSVVYTGTSHDPVTIEQITFSNSINERKVVSASEVVVPSDKVVHWYNVVGLHDTNLITTLGQQFGWHTLVQEDIVNVTQRPVIEEFDSYIFISLKMLTRKNSLDIEHVSMLVGPNYVVSFQEKKGDVFESVRNRISQKKKIVERASDYLTYALLDSVIDHYFSTLESVGESIEDIDEQLLQQHKPSLITEINNLKRELILIRRIIWPLRDVLYSVKRSEHNFWKKQTSTYFNDAYDHTLQVLEVIDSQKEFLASTMDMYNSNVNNNMNQIMKVLTVFAAIFIPLTFVAGIYGMNFAYIPELQHPYGYFFVWGAFVIIALGMIGLFKVKKWI